jgi:uncharacterized surface anchored protein
MISAFFRSRTTVVLGSVVVLGFAVSAHGQNDQHWRKYKKLAPAATITVLVEKAANGNPISNASVVFRATREGKDEGSLEIKTDPDGNAKIDIIEIGSHVTVQVIADGYATAAAEFDVPGDEKSVLIKMEKPRAQVSTYQDNDGKVSQRPAGVQEPRPMIGAKPRESAHAHGGLVTVVVANAAGSKITFANITLRDPKGVLPSVPISLDKEGKYRKADVAPGMYEMTVTASGYASQTREGVIVLNEDNLILDVKLPAVTASTPERQK